MVSRREAGVVVGILAVASFGFAGLGEASAKSAKSEKSAKSAKSAKPVTRCVYELQTTGTETGSAVVNIRPNSLRIRVRGAVPNTLYTIWTDHRKRLPVKMLTPDYPPFPVDPSTSLHGNPHPRGVAPALASTAGIASGMGIDQNAFVTNAQGNANFRVRLDYNLLEPGASPVIAEDLAMQGENIVGGSWLRMFTAPVVAASVQAVDGDGLPVLVRSTAQGFTVQRHDDPTTHGHFPGTGGVDHTGTWTGDIPADCLP